MSASFLTQHCELSGSLSAFSIISAFASSQSLLFMFSPDWLAASLNWPGLGSLTVDCLEYNLFMICRCYQTQPPGILRLSVCLKCDTRTGRRNEIKDSKRSQHIIAGDSVCGVCLYMIQSLESELLQIKYINTLRYKEGGPSMERRN